MKRAVILLVLGMVLAGMTVTSMVMGEPANNNNNYGASQYEDGQGQAGYNGDEGDDGGYNGGDDDEACHNGEGVSPPQEPQNNANAGNENPE